MQKNKVLNLMEVNEILSDTLIKVINKEMSLKQAKVISQTALALSKNITNIELKNRIEFLEQSLKQRRR